MEYIDERFGIHDVSEAITEFKVQCCNCMNIYYEKITDERNYNALHQLYNAESQEYFLGCPKCETDEYLINYDSNT